MADALANLTSVVTTCLSIITGNEVLMACFVLCVAGAGFGVIKKAKNAAR